MGASLIPFVIFTVLWGGVGIVLPIFVPKGPNRGIIQVILMLTGVCCWLLILILLLLVTIYTTLTFMYVFFSWLCCYVAQMNPLIGPKLEQNIILIMADKWGNSITD